MCANLDVGEFRSGGVCPWSNLTKANLDMG